MHLAQPPNLLRLTARLPTILNARQTWSPAFSLCAQNCLQSDTGSTICVTYSTEEEQNSCLCNDGSFITSVAQCCSASCGAADLEFTASTWVSNCGDAGTPSVLNYQEILSAAGVACEFDTIPSTTHILQSITSH
jgi:hypothetical protein